VHFSQEEDILIQSVYEKTHEERGNEDREGEESALPQIRKEDPKKAIKI